MNFVKKHAAWLVGFGALFVIFLHPLFTLEKGFTLGDYDQQFYPWTKYFADELRAGRWAFWTPLIQCGFPLFAEGQTAMLYLPNLLLFAPPLPFNIAYNAMFLAHFILGGIFSYAFARKRGLSSTASAVFSIAFTFGSAYAGCFYNIVTMRTLVWLPALLWLIERGLGALRISWVWWVYALVLSQALLGGFLQTSFYGLGFAALYFILRFRVRGGTIRDFWCFVLANALALIIASPQIWASLELAGHTTRSAYAGSHFALWGSAEPWAFSTLFMASWGTFSAARVYIGVVPFLLLFYKPRSAARDAWILAALSVLLALGKYNPIWHLIVDLPVVGLLRNPSKFLFFTAFFLAFVASSSLDQLITDLEARSAETSRYLRRMVFWCAGFLVLAIAAAMLIRVFEPAILEWGRRYVEENVFGKAHHRQSMEYYIMKFGGLLDIAQGAINLKTVFFWTPFLFSILFLASLAFCKKVSQINLKVIVIALLCLDLFVYGRNSFGTGFIGNVGPFPDAAQFDSLPKNGRYVEFISPENELLPPNRNMLYGISHAGAYSPLIDNDYAQHARRLGAIDDSFGREKTDPTVFLIDDPLLDSLAVKYILTDKTVLHPSLKLFGSIDGRFLFENTHVRSEAFLRVPKGPNLPIAPRESAPDGSESYVFTTAGDVELVRVVTYDNGWKATVDGRKTPIQRAGAFQSVRIEGAGPGERSVKFRYAPNWFVFGFWFYFGGLALIFMGLLHSLLRRK